MKLFQKFFLKKFVKIKGTFTLTENWFDGKKNWRVSEFVVFLRKQMSREIVSNFVLLRKDSSIWLDQITRMNALFSSNGWFSDVLFSHYVDNHGTIVQVLHKLQIELIFSFFQNLIQIMCCKLLWRTWIVAGWNLKISLWLKSGLAVKEIFWVSLSFSSR